MNGIRVSQPALRCIPISAKRFNCHAETAIASTEGMRSSGSIQAPRDTKNDSITLNRIDCAGQVAVRLMASRQPLQAIQKVPVSSIQKPQ